MHEKCHAWGPRGRSAACPCLPTKDVDFFSQQSTFSPVESLWVTPAQSASLLAGSGPRGVWGGRGGHKQAVINTCCYSWHLLCVKGLYWGKRMVLVVLFIPFCCSAPCQTLESTQRQRTVHLSVNKGYLFKMRINSEFWQLSVWGCLLWGWGKGHETCCLLEKSLLVAFKAKYSLEKHWK